MAIRDYYNDDYECEDCGNRVISDANICRCDEAAKTPELPVRKVTKQMILAAQNAVSEHYHANVPHGVCVSSPTPVMVIKKIIQAALDVMDKGAPELPDQAQQVDEYSECSGDPKSCPENEGYGCCEPNPQKSTEPPARKDDAGMVERVATALLPWLSKAHPQSSDGNKQLFHDAHLEAANAAIKAMEDDNGN